MKILLIALGYCEVKEIPKLYNKYEVKVVESKIVKSVLGITTLVFHKTNESVNYKKEVIPIYTTSEFIGEYPRNLDFIGIIPDGYYLKSSLSTLFLNEEFTPVN